MMVRTMVDLLAGGLGTMWKEMHASSSHSGVMIIVMVVLLLLVDAAAALLQFRPQETIGANPLPCPTLLRPPQ